MTDRYRKTYMIAEEEKKEPLHYTALELSERAAGDCDRWIPDEFVPGYGLVYSSPATLAYNSPGAEGYGVKRAALSVPGSVELIISPGCCGRNTTDIASLPGYRDRFYYLQLDETDIVTGRHLKRIPEAVRRILSDRERKGLKKPSAVMLVTTCVDALLGTDMESIAKKCAAECGLPVRAAYMYALTRDGDRPPMVQVRESIFSMLKKRKTDRESVNVLGYFGGIPQRALVELFSFFADAGIRKVRTLRGCRNYSQFEKFSDASFNVVLDPEARAAALYMEKQLGIGFVEMKRFYGIERVSSQYRALLKALDLKEEVNDKWYKACRDFVDGAVDEIKKYSGRVCFAVGECADANAPELALALLEYGFEVKQVFCTLTEEDRWYLPRIAERSPQTKFYFNQHPSMAGFYPDPEVNFCIGKDAAWYYRERDVIAVEWNQDRQPFGYYGIESLFAKLSWEVIRRFLGETDEQIDSLLNRLIKDAVETDAEEEAPETELRLTAEDRRILQLIGFGREMRDVVIEPEQTDEPPVETAKVHGYRRVLTPFAPDQSGAVSVLFPLNSLTVILDAGGCTGNTCGFDLPEWSSMEGTMICSAGLRDMDAVFGRDRELVRKITDALKYLHPGFISLIGTPVPSTIGTDINGLRLEVEKATGLPVIAVDTNGMELYDRGIAKTYRQLKDTFPQYSVLCYGRTPLDYSDSEEDEILDKLTRGDHERGLAFSVSGYEASGGRIAPPEIIVSDRMREQTLSACSTKGSVMIIGEQIYANALRTLIRKEHPRKKTVVAGFFHMYPELMKKGDVKLKEEDDLADVVRKTDPSLIVADPVLKELLPFYRGRWIERRHFALSGKKS